MNDLKLIVFGVITLLLGLVFVVIGATQEKKCISTSEINVPQRFTCVELSYGPTYCKTYQLVEAHKETVCNEYEE